MNILKLTFLIIFGTIAFHLNGQVSDKAMDKFKMKYAISDSYDKGHVFSKNGKFGFADNKLKTIIKPIYDILIYNAENDHVPTSMSIKSVNDGGGEIKIEYSDLQIIKLSNKQVKPILENYYIFHRPFTLLKNKINNNYYPVVKNKSTNQLNIIDSNGKLLLKKEYDNISGFIDDGKLYGITKSSKEKRQYDILDINGNIYYESNEVIFQNPRNQASISSRIGSFANNSYGLTNPVQNEFNIIKFETLEQLLDKNYSKIEIVDKWDKKQAILFELQSSESFLSIFDPISKQLIIKEFKGSIEYGTEREDLLLKCINEEKLTNYFKVESKDFMFPIWIKSSMKIQGQANMYILTTGDAENLMYGIYDISTKTFFKEMSSQKIIEESGLTMKTKERYHVISYFENGKKIKIKFN